MPGSTRRSRPASIRSTTASGPGPAPGRPGPLRAGCQGRSGRRLPATGRGPPGARRTGPAGRGLLRAAADLGRDRSRPPAGGRRQPGRGPAACGEWPGDPGPGRAAGPGFPAGHANLSPAPGPLPGASPATSRSTPPTSTPWPRGRRPGRWTGSCGRWTTTAAASSGKPGGSAGKCCGLQETHFWARYLHGLCLVLNRWLEAHGDLTVCLTRKNHVWPRLLRGFASSELGGQYRQAVRNEACWRSVAGGGRRPSGCAAARLGRHRPAGGQPPGRRDRVRRRPRRLRPGPGGAAGCRAGGRPGSAGPLCRPGQPGYTPDPHRGAGRRRSPTWSKPWRRGSEGLPGSLQPGPGPARGRPDRRGAGEPGPGHRVRAEPGRPLQQPGGPAPGQQRQEPPPGPTWSVPWRKARASRADRLANNLLQMGRLLYARRNTGRPWSASSRALQVRPDFRLVERFRAEALLALGDTDAEAGRAPAHYQEAGAPGPLPGAEPPAAHRGTAGARPDPRPAGASCCRPSRSSVPNCG